MRRIQRPLLERAEHFVILGEEVRGVFTGRGSNQRQTTHIMKQASKVSFL